MSSKRNPHLRNRVAPGVRWAGGLLATGLLALSINAWACSCLPYPDDPREAVERAWPQSDAMIAGTVVAQRTHSSPDRGEVIEVTITVARSWKGPQGKELKVRTSSSSASCGYNFETNRQYLIAASRDEQTGEYSTGLCSLTRPLEEARALVRALDARSAAK